MGFYARKTLERNSLCNTTTFVSFDLVGPLSMLMPTCVMIFGPLWRVSCPSEKKTTQPAQPDEPGAHSTRPDQRPGATQPAAPTCFLAPKETSRSAARRKNFAGASSDGKSNKTHRRPCLPSDPQQHIALVGSYPALKHGRQALSKVSRVSGSRFGHTQLGALRPLPACPPQATSPSGEPTSLSLPKR